MKCCICKTAALSTWRYMQNTAAKAAWSWATGLFSASCCYLGHWVHSLLATPTGPWPHSPNPNYSKPWHPAKRRNRLGTCSPWRFLNRKKIPLTVAASSAIEHVKTLRPELLGMWLSEKDRGPRERERETSNTTSNKKMRERKGEENKTTVSFH